MHEMTTWLIPMLDVGTVALLGLVLWRLGHDPTATWREREDKLREICEGLRRLVGEAEARARDLNDELAGHGERLQALLAAAETVPPRSSVPGAAPDLAERVRGLAAASVPVEGISRRLGVPDAEVRFLLGLRPVRAAEVEREKRGSSPPVAAVQAGTEKAAETSRKILPAGGASANPSPWRGRSTGATRGTSVADHGPRREQGAQR
jgi:hypothetical protein